MTQVLKDLRVLVIDDSAANRQMLHAMLTDWHMKPVTVGGGTAALAALDEAAALQQRFDLLVVDAKMPGMDGFTTVERIRQRPELAPPVILMLDGDVWLQEIPRCRALKAIYLVKPVDPFQMFESIVAAVRPAAVPDAPKGVPPTRALVWGTRSLRILLADENALNQLVAVRALFRAGHRVVVTLNAQEAAEALKRTPFDLVLTDVPIPEQRTAKHPPIVAMTDPSIRKDRAPCPEAGIDGYVHKPIQEQELLAAIGAAVLDKEGSPWTEWWPEQPGEPLPVSAEPPNFLQQSIDVNRLGEIANRAERHGPFLACIAHGCRDDDGECTFKTQPAQLTQKRRAIAFRHEHVEQGQ